MALQDLIDKPLEELSDEELQQLLHRVRADRRVTEKPVSVGRKAGGTNKPKQQRIQLTVEEELDLI